MLRNVCVSIVVVFFLPLLVHAVWWQLQGHPSSWAEADWSSSGVLPAAPDVTGPVVHVLAGRTGRWKGIFAHHTWIVVKARGAPRYKRFEVVGWGTALRVDNYPADGRWYGNVPDVVLTLTGADAERAFAGIERASAAYKYAGGRELSHLAGSELEYLRRCRRERGARARASTSAYRHRKGLRRLAAVRRPFSEPDRDTAVVVGNIRIHDRLGGRRGSEFPRARRRAWM